MTTGQFPKKRESDEQRERRISKRSIMNPAMKVPTPLDRRKNRDLTKGERTDEIHVRM